MKINYQQLSEVTLALTTNNFVFLESERGVTVDHAVDRIESLERLKEIKADKPEQPIQK